MSDKGSKALRKAIKNISTSVSKLNSAIESVKEQDIVFTEVDAVRKLATNCFQFFLEHGVLDENAHLHKPKHRSSRSHLAGPDRRQNVRTTPGSEGSADKRPKPGTRTGIKDARPTPFCDDVKVTSNFEDDQTRDRDNKCIAELEDPNKYLTYQGDLAEKEKSETSRNDCFERNPRKLREFEEKYKVTSLENIRLRQELDRVNKCIAELENQNKHLTYQAEKEKSETSRKCKHKDGLQEKSDKDLRQLKTVISNLQSDIAEYKQTNATLSNRLEVLREEKLELEESMRSPQDVSGPRNCQNYSKCRNEISDLKRDRLSEAAGNEPRENNPNIADLSDMNRPTSLADKFNSLYTDEYTDAMEVIESSMDEAGAVHVMLEWLKSCYNWCERLAKEQRDLLTTESIGFMKKYHGQKQDFVVSENCLIHVKEFQKKIAGDTLTAIREICHVQSVTQKNLIDNSYIVKYIQKCSELCWRMQITDPPLCLKFDVKNGENLDKNLYNAFTKNGSRIEYLVWPSLFLHKSGPLMAKGVAEGT